MNSEERPHKDSAARQPLDAPKDRELGYLDGELVRLLAIGKSQVAIAANLGMSDRTIRRRLQDPDFRRLVSDARADLHAESWSKLLGLREKAASVLDDSLNSEDDRVRLQAAKYVFEIGSRTRREQLLDEMRQRIDDLDDRLSPDPTPEEG